MSGKKVSEKGQCVYCGTQAPSGALYCPRCGEPIDPSHLYDESTSSREAVVGEGENLNVDEITATFRPLVVRESMSAKVLYEGMIRGLVIGDSRVVQAPVLEAQNMLSPIPYYGFAEVCFIVRLEEGFEGVPDEILVFTSKFGYFRMGDKVILQGIILKNLEQRNRPRFLIFADNFYNESLHLGDVRSGLGVSKQVLYKGTIRGLVTGESRERLSNQSFYGYYFVLKLEENIGIEEIPEEILVRYMYAVHFRIGDKLILQGKIIKKKLKQWDRPMYLILAEHFYNETLQFGDKVFT
nr:zinc ribbon domain-containing protein [Candidatus Freyarchaeota archaeon]